ncbi:MAG: hypothetical protein AAF321_02005 [Pseudomonadota bacterium]
MTLRTNAILAAATLAIVATTGIGSASAASINDENRLRDLSAHQFTTKASGRILTGRLSQSPVGFSINDENLQRAHSAPQFDHGVSTRIFTGRSSANPSSGFINDENRGRFDTFKR